MDLARTLALILVLSPLPGGCSDPSPAGDAGPPQDRILEVLTGLDVGLTPGSEASLRLRYVDGAHGPVTGEAVQFAIFGDPHGSTLSTDTALSDGGGVATIQVRAGAVVSRFQVQASAQGARDVTFYVEVSDAGFGAVAVAGHYLGFLDQTALPQIKKVVYTLYANIGCSSFDPFNPPPALRTRNAGKMTEQVLFESLPLDVSHTIAATAYRQVGTEAEGNWQLRATGCLELPVGVLKGTKQLAVGLSLTDQLPRLRRTYQLVSSITLPLTNRPLSDALAPFGDLVDCPLDPEQRLLDCMLDAVDAGDPLDCVITQPVAKTLALLAERGVPVGGCRGSSTNRGTPSLESKLRQLVTDTAVYKALKGVEAKAAVGLREMRLESQLEVFSSVVAHRLSVIAFVSPSSQVASFSVAQIGTPKWAASPVPVHIGPLAGSPWSWELTLDQHHFSPAYGLLARQALGTLVLQPVGLAHSSTALAAQLVQLVQSGGLKGCSAIEPVLCTAARLEPGCLGSACVDGQSALAVTLDAGFAQIDGQPTDLSLVGKAELIDSDGDLEIDGLGEPGAPGRWDSSLMLATEIVVPNQATFIGKP